MKTAIQTRSLLLYCAGLCAAAVVLLAVPAFGTAQTTPQTPQAQTKPGTTPIQQHTPTAAQAVVAPPAPKPPDWPANNHPTPAKVVWDSQGLRIEASNSSLDEILHDVAADTGAKIEGLSQDQRIFGSYGPGPARDVLAQLLDGSGYNMLLVGDLGNGTPRQVVLSTRPTGTSQPAHAQTAKSAEEDVEEEPPPPPPTPEEPQPPQPPQPGVSPNNGAPPATPRTPQEIMQEMQQRQQQLQQQSQQLQQQLPPQQQ